MTKRAAIILAGGKGKRFQTTNGQWQDKALAKLYGKPLLIHAAQNIQGVVDEIVVVADRNQARMEQYYELFEKYCIKAARIVSDLKIPNLSGPLIAILTGLKVTDADFCITVPCDVPMLSPKVAKYIFEEIDGSSVAVPMWPNGKLETLLMVLERKNTIEIATTLSGLGRSHPDDLIRGALKTLFVSPLGAIKVLDPELKSFVNINSPEDLSCLQPRQGQGTTAENVRLDLGAPPLEEIWGFAAAALKRGKRDFAEASGLFFDSAVALERMDMFFWAAVSREYQAKSLLDLFGQRCKRELVNSAKDAFLNAAANYGSEAQIYEGNGCFLLAERARADRVWCESQVEKW